jgi:hypothetical protein
MQRAPLRGVTLRAFANHAVKARKVGFGADRTARLGDTSASNTISAVPRGLSATEALHAPAVTVLVLPLSHLRLRHRQALLRGRYILVKRVDAHDAMCGVTNEAGEKIEPIQHALDLRINTQHSVCRIIVNG